MDKNVNLVNNTINSKPNDIKEVLNINNCKIHNIPKEIKSQNKWLFGNAKKSPVDINGYNVDWRNSKYYKSFVSVTTNNPKNLYYSYFLDNDYVIIDLDKCFDDNKELYTWAKEIIYNLDIEKTRPYIEYSISGYGLHIIYKVSKSLSNKNNASVKINNVHSKFNNMPKKCGVEVFLNKHCMILTGNIYKNYSSDKLPMANNKVKDLYNKINTLKKINVNKVKDVYDRNIEMKKDDLNNIFDYVKSEVDIIDLLEKYDVNYEGSHVKCILHDENTPSMAIYEITNSFYCFGCNQGGSIIDLVALKENVTPFKAIVLLNEWFDLNIDFSKQNESLIKEWFILDHKNKYQLDHTVLRNHLIQEYHIINTEQKIYIYKDGVYKIVEKQEIIKLIEEHMIDAENNRFKSSRYVDEVYKQVLRNFQSFENFNTDDQIINFKNHMLKMQYGTSNYIKLPHNTSLLTTFQLNYNYNPNAKCEIFNKFLNDTLNKEQQQLLQEVMGYSLILNNRAKKFFGFYGVGDTGKSVVLRILSKIIGEQNTSAVPLQDLTRKGSRFDTSSLLGKAINICGDIPGTPLEDTGIIKMLTGDDKMKSEKKGQDSIFVYNLARMYFSMNQLPTSYDKSQEFFNRFIIIPFNNVCPKDKQDKELINKFNYEGILNWMVEGLRRLLNNNLNFSTVKTNEDIIEDYIKQDSPVVDFIDRWCDLDKNGSIITKDLLSFFKLYCDEENNLFSCKKTGNKLRKEIISKFKTVKESKNIINTQTKKPTARGLVGLKIKSDILAEYRNILDI